MSHFMKGENRMTDKIQEKVKAPRALPLPKNLDRCKGCHYPAVGFICWSPDGTCLRTEEERINRLERRRRK